MTRPKPKRTPVRPASPEVDPPKIRKDRLKEYREAIKSKGIVEVLTLADDDCLANVKLHISTQSLELDRLLNRKGIPTGRVTEVFGPPHIGKSTIMDHLFAEVQKMNGVAILADTEGARDIAYTRAIGVDPGTLEYLEFDKGQLTVENVLTSIYRTIEFWRDRYPDTPVVIGWDALGGTATRDEIKKELTAQDAKVAGAAKVLREACRLIPTKLGNTKIAVVIANHEYEKIDLGAGRGAGPKRETYGGAAIRHLASIRLQLFHGGWVKRSDGEILGREVGVKLTKNRLGAPWGEARIALLPGVGVDNIWSIFHILRHAGIIQLKESWAAINLDGQILKFQGWSGLASKCAEDPTLFSRLVAVVRGLP
jgi:recombination protein RecA